MPRKEWCDSDLGGKKPIRTWNRIAFSIPNSSHQNTLRFIRGRYSLKMTFKDVILTIGYLIYTDIVLTKMIQWMASGIFSKCIFELGVMKYWKEIQHTQFIILDQTQNACIVPKYYQ
ncbi:uncharacterized protein LOC129975620 [Argiope bruennichi]|uniref:uncharacterized protein LOC129975620 n=1 Tax=Argiope bruennichi TaxID=94029 RepID=UPI002494D672|nr:uncharacterized protein LOC129975620 [Argiope bruennichi]